MGETCQSCSAPVVWARTIAGRPTPMQPDPTGLWLIVDGVTKKAKPEDQGPRFTSHFASCPDAQKWRKRS